MAGETYVTLSGNLTAPPKSGMSRGGIPWTRIRVASSARVFDRQTSEWRDGETLFVDVSCWRRLAENAAKTLERGDRVLIHGRLRQRSYEDQQGVRHTVTEMEAEAMGPDLGRAAAHLVRSAAPSREAEPGVTGSAEAVADGVADGSAEGAAEPAPAMAGAPEPAWP